MIENIDTLSKLPCNYPIYNRVQVFSGGGSRFGYYLGSYACLYDNGLAPDFILATCGGSLAALLVDIAPEPKHLSHLIKSRELYRVVSASQGRQLEGQRTRQVLLQVLLGKGLPKYVYHAIKRALFSNKQTVDTYQELLTELQQLAMFEIANESKWLDELVALKAQPQYVAIAEQSSAPDIAIIASRLHAPPQNTVNDKPPVRLQEVLFAPDKLADKTTGQHAFKCPTYHYAPKRLLPDIKIVSGRCAGVKSTDGDGWHIAQAVRASMADMYYLAPIYIDTLGWCLGGVIDLTPIELACHLGDTVFAETKQAYDKRLAVPAIKRVFGFDANERLQAINNYQRGINGYHYGNRVLSSQVHWLPFADNGNALAGQHGAKNINLKQFNLDLVHAPYDIFQEQMQAQWDYGYQRTLDYLNNNY